MRDGKFSARPSVNGWCGAIFLVIPSITFDVDQACQPAVATLPGGYALPIFHLQYRRVWLRSPVMPPQIRRVELQKLHFRGLHGTRSPNPV